ncbi:molybdenum cofactor biosynthesis protein MoaE [Elstera litoralis]|uniref:Molybdopterin synthase catalytic subunit n=1 Tax=Elstera litoralis TaxID=552518 RepID=A0A0F3IWA1_9PROT|nr:molybdenum cofactor biosynthesis protein MoaE [Elstera litoralis]
MAIVTRVQAEAFEPGAELSQFTQNASAAGAIVSFTGLVRGQDHAGRALTAMTLEHYPGMTEAQVQAITEEAARRWPLQAVLVIHRFGRLAAGEPIVFVATASAHRSAAFEAADFLMDWLKTKAPFWKLEEGADRAEWVAAKAEDDQAAARWR